MDGGGEGGGGARDEEEEEEEEVGVVMKGWMVSYLCLCFVIVVETRG